MKVQLTNQEFDTLLLPIEWRYSAAVAGLIRFFDFIEETEGIKLYRKTSTSDRSRIPAYDEMGGYIEGIMYNRSALTEERYISFCEHFFANDMQHIQAERILKNNTEYSDELKSAVNNLLTGTQANTVLKKIFGKTKFDGSNATEILGIIEENRTEIVRETFRFKTNLYRNYANTNKLFTDENPHCRLLGYDLDENRKSKSIAYRFDTNTFIARDEYEFDFIPFAFSNSPEAFFINNNCSIDVLMKCNDLIKQVMDKEAEVQDNKEIKDSNMTKLIKQMIKSYEFFDYDVEVIIKSRRLEMFDTFYVRKGALKRLKKIYETSNIRFVYKYNYNYYLNVEESVINCCLNNMDLDGLIERLLVIGIKEENKFVTVVITKLIGINVDWKGVKGMSDITERARNVGYGVGQKIKGRNGENKVKSYKNKLTNAIVAHDYDRVLEIMLQMSGYVDGEISVIYDIIDNKEHCFDIAVSFTNALIPYEKDK